MNTQPRRNLWMGACLAIIATCAVCANSAYADTFTLGQMNVNYSLIVSYGVAIRTKNPSPELINGPIDSIQYNFSNLSNGSFATHTGLPTTINQDDADRNFAKGSLINNRVSGLAQIQFSYQNYGAVFSGDGFYDQTYHRPNDNNSPGTINKTGPVNQFTAAARYYDGQRVRLLDAYVYGDWYLNDNLHLNVRLGKHLVAWGQSLFFSGISSAQSTADATKAFVPGAEIKDILLPTNQISASLAIGFDWTVKAYYKFNFKPNELFPVGDYFSPTDSVGPGAQFSYGAANPAYTGGCTVISAIVNIPISQLCNTVGPNLGSVIGAPKYILIPLHQVLKPSAFGQYGVGVTDQVTPTTSVGLYWLRYTDPNPSVVQYPGYPSISTTFPQITTRLFNEPTAAYYNVVYFTGIDMIGASYSTIVGPVNVAGEVSYRRNASIAVQADELGTIDPVFSRGEDVQALTSAIYTTNPNFWFDTLTMVGEVGYNHVTGVKPKASEPGITTLDNGQKLFYSRNSWAFETLTSFGKSNIINGVDLSIPVVFGWLVDGTPSVPGAFGALYGQGDMRLSLGLNFLYLQNLNVGLGYNFFFGSPSKTIGNSFLKVNPYADRDYATFSVKYSL